MSADLGRLAREALASARQATLLVAEVGSVDCEVDLFEIDGRPQFACTADSPVATAAGSEAHLLVPLGCARSRGGGTVRLRGRLVLAVCKDGHAIVELDMESVTVQRGRHGTAHDVPLDVYLAADDNPLPAFAARLVTHTNAAHGTQLRQVAASHCGRASDGIAAASLADLDAHGVDLQWIDADGYHVSRLSFPRPATTTRQLAALLREHLHRGDS